MKLAENILSLCKPLLGESKDDHSLWDIFTTKKKYTIKANLGAKKWDIKKEAEKGIGIPVVSLIHKGDYIDGILRKTASESTEQVLDVPDSGIVLDLREETKVEKESKKDKAMNDKVKAAKKKDREDILTCIGNSKKYGWE